LRRRNANNTCKKSYKLFILQQDQPSNFIHLLVHNLNSLSSNSAANITAFLNTQQIGNSSGVQLPNISLGANADDILWQANRNNQYYGYTNDSKGIQQANEAWQREQRMNDPAYNPSLRNSIRNNQAINKQEELFNCLNEIAKNDNNRFSKNNYSIPNFTSANFLKKIKSYTQALQTLKDMLNGKQKLSLREAYFAIENAYG